MSRFTDDVEYEAHEKNAKPCPFCGAEVYRAFPSVETGNPDMKNALVIVHCSNHGCSFQGTEVIFSNSLSEDEFRYLNLMTRVFDKSLDFFAETAIEMSIEELSSNR